MIDQFSDPIPEKRERPPEDQERIEKGAQYLMMLYELMKRKIAPDYRLNKEMNNKSFQRLARRLIEYGIDPGKYIMFVFSVYQTPYPNVVCSVKAVERYNSLTGVFAPVNEMLHSIQMFNERIEMGFKPVAAARHLEGQVSSFELYCLLRRYGDTATAETYKDQAEVSWLFMSERQKVVYSKTFADVLDDLNLEDFEL